MFGQVWISINPVIEYPYPSALSSSFNIRTNSAQISYNFLLRRSALSRNVCFWDSLSFLLSPDLSKMTLCSGLIDNFLLIIAIACYCSGSRQAVCDFVQCLRDQLLLWLCIAKLYSFVLTYTWHQHQMSKTLWF